MKVLLLASDNLENTRLIAEGLTSKFVGANGISPFMRLVQVDSADNNLITPTISPSKVKAEFASLARNHKAFDVNSYLSFNTRHDSTRNIIAVVPVSPLNIDDVAEKLKHSGFQVFTGIVDYQRTQNADDKQSLISLASDKCDMKVSGNRIKEIIDKIGTETSMHFRVMLTIDQQIERAFSVRQSPLSGTFSTAQLVAERAMNSRKVGLGPATLTKQFMDSAITTLQESGVNSFSELPVNKQKFIVERAYVHSVINASEMTNILFNNQSNIPASSPDLAGLIGLVERLNILSNRLVTARNDSQVFEIANRIDSLLTDPKYTNETRRYLFLPETLRVDLEIKCSEVTAPLNIIDNDFSASTEYNPVRPAFSSVTQAFIESQNQLFDLSIKQSNTQEARSNYTNHLTM